MTNLHNFANQTMFEYHSIFPNVASLLDHLLFVIGNGYNFDEDRGMIFSGYEDDNNVRFLDELPELDEEQWATFLDYCYKKEEANSRMYTDFGYPPEKIAKRIDEAKSKYKRVSVTDEDFSEQSLLSQLVSTAKDRWDEYSKYDGMNDSMFYRPYPLSENYAKIFKLNNNTPKWFVQIAINLCKAWVQFLTDEIERKNFCTNDKGSYATETYTVLHRDMLVDEVVRLEGLTK